MTFYKPILATSRPLSKGRACPRCGGVMSDRHPSLQCADCNDIVRLEKSYARWGVDLLLMTELEFLELEQASAHNRKHILRRIGKKHQAMNAHPSMQGKAAA